MHWERLIIPPTKYNNYLQKSISEVLLFLKDLASKSVLLALREVKLCRYVETEVCIDS